MSNTEIENRGPQCSTGPAPSYSVQGPCCFDQVNDPDGRATDPDKRDDLADFLSFVEYDASLSVEAVLKKSEFEETQLVVRADDQQEKHVLYIRKYLRRDHGLGAIYEEIYRAQTNGVVFTHIPRIHNCYLLKDELVVVMDYIQGETLDEIVSRCGPSVDLAVLVFPQVCQAVRELHETFHPPIIHRDLKPANIVVSHNRVTLIDFGIARVYHDGHEKDTVRFGTREYAPPEQFGYGQTDVRSDVYALGMVLFYCLTGRTADALTRNACFQHDAIPEEIRQIIAHACAFDPDDRYQCVAAMAEAFSCAIACQGIAQRTSSEKTNLDRSDSEPRTDSRESHEPSRLSHDPTVPGALGSGTSDSVSTRSGKREGMRAASVLRSELHAIPKWLGGIWNVLLLLIWGLVLAACISSAFDPNDDALRGYPLWYRAYGCMGFVGLSWTSFTYVALDKRVLFAKFPSLKRFSFPLRALIFGLGIPVATLVIFIMLTFVITPPIIAIQ